MRFVIDTNLLVSAIISTGLPRQLLDAARAGEFELCTSEIVLAELLDVLGRGKFADRLAQAGLSRNPSSTTFAGSPSWSRLRRCRVWCPPTPTTTTCWRQHRLARST